LVLEKESPETNIVATPSRRIKPVVFLFFSPPFPDSLFVTPTLDFLNSPPRFFCSKRSLMLSLAHVVVTLNLDFFSSRPFSPPDLLVFPPYRPKVIGIRHVLFSIFSPSLSVSRLSGRTLRMARSFARPTTVGNTLFLGPLTGAGPLCNFSHPHVPKPTRLFPRAFPGKATPTGQIACLFFCSVPCHYFSPLEIAGGVEQIFYLPVPPETTGFYLSGLLQILVPSVLFPWCFPCVASWAFLSAALPFVTRTSLQSLTAS